MYHFFKFERNEKCPCGSEKKYKKCCQPAIEKAMSQFDGNWKQLFPGLAEALGAVCGLSAGEGEVVPEPKKINRSVQKLVETLQDEDDDKVMLALKRRMDTLTGLFRDEEKLLNNLFPFNVLQDFMVEIEARLTGDDEESEFKSIFEEMAEEYLPQLVNKYEAENMAWSLLDLLRKREWDDWSLDCLVTGLMLSLEKDVSTNPLWLSVLWVSLEKNSQAVAEMEEIKEKLSRGEENIVQLLEDYFKRNPIMKSYWLKRLWKETVPVLRAIENKDICLEVPLYSVLGSLTCMVDYAKELKNDTLDKVANKILNSKSGIESESISKGMLLDFNIFLDEIFNFFNKWIKQENVPQDLKTSVAALLFCLATGTVPAQLYIFEAIYFSALLNVAANLPVTLPGSGDLPPLTLDWRDFCFREKLEAYAMYLENTGNKEGGTHVRKVISEVMGD